MRVIAVVCCLVFVAIAAQAQEKKVAELNAVRLYNSETSIRERSGDDVTLLANYVKSLANEASAFWETAQRPEAKGLLVAVGIKPGKKSRIWCDAVEGAIPADMLAKLEKKLAEVPAVAVKDGPIAFAIEIRLWAQKPHKFPVWPGAWLDVRDKAKEPLIVPDGLFKIIWPE